MKNLGFLSKVFFSGTLLSLFFSGSGSAATLYVHPEQGVYPQIQLAINAAIIGDEILVAPGVYQPVTFTKQQIHVQSEKGPEVTKIIGSGVGAAVYFSQLSTGSSISGFHISGPDNGVKVDCSTPGNICRTLSIKNNIIEGAGLNGISLIAGSSKCGEGSEISHVAIANNTIVGSVRSGIAFDLKGREEEDQCEESSGKIQFVKTENNIIVKNRKYGIHRMDRDESPFTDNTFFNNVFRNNRLDDGKGVTLLRADGNIFSDPKLASPETGDFKLLANSPAIDAGMEGSVYLDPDGTRNNIGAYGGPGAALFWPDPKGGPVVTALSVTPTEVSQGEMITVKATGTIR